MSSRKPDLTIRLIRAFDGPRHERVRTIWQAIAEYAAPVVNVRWFANTGGRLRHAQSYNRMWNEEVEFDNRFVLFTEEDFLPDLAMPLSIWTGLRGFVDKNQAAVACMYATRSEKNFEMLQDGNKPGAWFVCMDKREMPRVFNFEGNPDPCNDMPGHLFPYGKTIRCHKGLDPYPLHYGLEYQMGTHLFWSRHWHDPPNMRVGAFSLRDIQSKVDIRVASWIQEQPQDFKTLLGARSELLTWASAFEPIALRGGYRKSLSKLDASPVAAGSASS